MGVRRSLVGRGEIWWLGEVGGERERCGSGDWWRYVG